MKISAVLATVCLITGIYLISTDKILVKREGKWSIGIYTGNSPYNFTDNHNIKNPVITANDVTDIPADFVADPFILHTEDAWYMFFEVINKITNQGDIGLAVSANGLSWKYQQIVLDEDYHLSYPYVFKWQGEFYMIPDSREANAVKLYKADDFPLKWSYLKTLLKGKLNDSSIFRYNNRWWMFTETNPWGNDVLRLYYADDLLGSWTEHPKSPIIDGNANIARPGGRVIVHDGRIIRYTQDDYPYYGNQLWAFEIIELTTTDYKERAIGKDPILTKSGKGWNAEGMHHLDAHKIDDNNWIASVDGLGKKKLVLQLNNKKKTKYRND